ncbi:MAG: hypothetical protein CMJ23_09235 [Phycisphaerae bacterium]|nr:hypothetical protein [Phycisphaerae bacterium]
MSDSSDPRPAVAVTLAPLGPDPRTGLQIAAALAVRGVQVSAGQAGTRARDLDRSGRRDLLIAARRLELDVVGIDAWFKPEDLLDPARVDDAVTALLATIELASDLGAIPVSTRFPAEGGEEAIEALMGAGNRVGVSLIDHGVPPRGMSVRPIDVKRPASGLVIPGSTEEVAVSSPPIGELIEGLGLGIDPPSWLVAGLDPFDAAGRGVWSLRLADLTADGMRIPAGDPDGRVDPVSLLAAARTGGLRHDPIIDARRWIDPVAGVRSTLASLA